MYQCSRCGYLSNRKYNLINHLKRKRICKPILLDVDTSELLKELTFDNRRKREIKQYVTRMSPECNPDVTRMSPECNPDVTRMSSNKNTQIYNCRYCNKPFKHRQGRSRHEKTRCIQKMNDLSEQKNEKLIEKVNQLQEQVDVLSKRQPSSNITTNSHNTNKNNTNSFNTVNVNLNTIGNENIEYLKTFLLENINNIIQCKTDFFIEYVKQKHFHPEHTENHNVVSFNQRSNSMYGYTKQEVNLERRLKNDISLLLYRNIIHDVNGFLDSQFQNKANKRKKQMILNRASDSMTNQEDALNDYEHKDTEIQLSSVNCKKNIKKVGRHIKEIENTIYNQSKHVYGDLSTYYVKHNVNCNNNELDNKDD